MMSIFYQISDENKQKIYFRNFSLTRPKPLAILLFVQLLGQANKNLKIPHHWPFVWGNHWTSVDSSDKGWLMQNVFHHAFLHMKPYLTWQNTWCFSNVAYNNLIAFRVTLRAGQRMWRGKITLNCTSVYKPMIAAIYSCQLWILQFCDTKLRFKWP